MSAFVAACGQERDYYDVVVDSSENPGAAWYYPEPMEAAKEISGYVAFWKGVTMEE